jgi:hypothetical protein
MAFSSEVDTGSREENASKQKAGWNYFGCRTGGFLGIYRLDCRNVMRMTERSRIAPVSFLNHIPVIAATSG